MTKGTPGDEVAYYNEETCRTCVHPCILDIIISFPKGTEMALKVVWVVSLHHEAKQPLVKWLCSKTTVSGGFTDPRVTANHVIPANYPIFLWCFTIICVFMTSWEQHFYIIIRESWHRVTYTNAEFFCKSTVGHKSGYRKTESTLTLHTSC